MTASTTYRNLPQLHRVQAERGAGRLDAMNDERGLADLLVWRHYESLNDRGVAAADIDFPLERQLLRPGFGGGEGSRAVAIRPSPLRRCLGRCAGECRQGLIDGSTEENMTPRGHWRGLERTCETKSIWSA